jgi:hypothetical protein
MGRRLGTTGSESHLSQRGGQEDILEAIKCSRRRSSSSSNNNNNGSSSKLQPSKTSNRAAAPPPPPPAATTKRRRRENTRSIRYSRSVSTSSLAGPNRPDAGAEGGPPIGLRAPPAPRPVGGRADPIVWQARPSDSGASERANERKMRRRWRRQTCKYTRACALVWRCLRAPAGLPSCRSFGQPAASSQSDRPTGRQTDVEFSSKWLGSACAPPPPRRRQKASQPLAAARPNSGRPK